MVITWSNLAKQDLRQIKMTSKANKSDYINALVEYTENLDASPLLGKKMFHMNYIENGKIISYEVRQLIYRKHRIIYSYDNEILILDVVHTSRDINNYINYLKENL